jgi:hypothetical protein
MNGTATIEVKLPVNLALLEYQSQIALKRWGMSVENYTQADLITAWTKAVQLYLERHAEDTDHFLARNGNEEAFLDALAVL